MVTKNKYLLFTGCFLLLLVIGYVDWVTGYDLHIGALYIVPIAVSSWYLGRFGTFFFAFAVVFARAWVDRDHPYAHHWFYYWNSCMRTATYLTLALCIRKISSVITAQREIIKELSDTFEESWRVGGLFPVCTVCKNMRTDVEYIERVQKFVEEHPNARFVHSVCPHCTDALKASQEQAPVVGVKIVPQPG